MAYGQKKLSALSQKIEPGICIAEKTAEGRELYQVRNEKLVARYYYYAVLKRKTSNEVLNILQSEFNISPKRIAQVLEDNSESIKALRKKAPTVQYFRNKYSYIVWK